MNTHPVDSLLCVARALAGNLHANYNAPIRFETDHCQKCESLKFCREIERLVKCEIDAENSTEAVADDKGN